ncbi:MAG: TetR/AcrR family transcriptional regulator [Chitinophagaceae bacterium]|nr:TetR/AcrR family transcriptional regulator [Chitinophagaceae bacterium]
MTLRDTLLNTTLNLFSRYGIKQATMDDVARACGISKKTLYRSYENKARLVDAVVLASVEQIRSEYREVALSSADAVQETIALLRHFEAICKRINYRMLLDLEKYYYDSWLRIDTFRQKIWRDIITENLQRGRAEKLYNDEFDKGIIATMRLQQLAFMHQTAMQNLALHETLLQVSIHYLKGIATARGLDRIREMTNQNNTI